MESLLVPGHVVELPDYLQRFLDDFVDKGGSDRELARRHGCTEKVAKNYMAIVLELSGARNRTELRVAAIFDSFAGRPKQEAP